MLPKAESERQAEATPAPAPAHDKHSAAAAAAVEALGKGLAAGRKPGKHAPGFVARLGS